MSEDFNPYLWDGSGEPDPEVRRLEQLLERYRHTQPLRVTTAAPRRRRVWLWAVSAVAASVAVFALYVALLPRVGRPGAMWKVAARAGSPLLAGNILRDAGLMGPGNSIETDQHSRAELFAGLIGSITVEPNSRLRMIGSPDDKHFRLALDRGRIAARLWAPPHTFAFETPSATAWDLGCAFTLEVQDSGYGLVRVTSGWVEFEDNDHETLIPAGAVAIALPGRGPGSPFYEDATADFKSALRRLDFETVDAAAHDSDFSQLLRDARARDIYTLLSLLRELSPAERGRIFDRAAQLSPPPSGVTRQGIVDRNWDMISAWHRSLGYSNAKTWWTHWPDALR